MATLNRAFADLFKFSFSSLQNQNSTNLEDEAMIMEVILMKNFLERFEGFFGASVKKRILLGLFAMLT